MKILPFASAMVIAVGATGAAIAADQASRSVTTADRDLGKLSIDGAAAYQDIGLARLAIFDGKPDQAAKLVNDAMASLTRAKTDDAVFTKAEADLTPPKTAANDTQKAETQKTGKPSTTPIAWVPVNGAFLLDETLSPTAAKTGAVNEANKHLQNGEPDKAKETLKVAAIDADYVMTLAPLEQTTRDVQQAATMMTNHNYYGASQQLRDAQMAVRYDTVVFQDPHAAAETGDTKTKG